MYMCGQDSAVGYRQRSRFIKQIEKKKQQQRSQPFKFFSRKKKQRISQTNKNLSPETTNDFQHTVHLESSTSLVERYILANRLLHTVIFRELL